MTLEVSLKVARKHRAKSKYPRYQHSYSGVPSVTVGGSLRTQRMFLEARPSRTWANMPISAPEKPFNDTHATPSREMIHLIDSEKDRRVNRTVYDADGRVVGSQRQELGLERCAGATCSSCEDKTSVWWVRAHSLAARLAPGRPVTCTQDICVRQCILCGNWQKFFATKTVVRDIICWIGGSQEHSVVNRPVIAIANAKGSWTKNKGRIDEMTYAQATILDFAQKRI